MGGALPTVAIPRAMLTPRTRGARALEAAERTSAWRAGRKMVRGRDAIAVGFGCGTGVVV